MIGCLSDAMLFALPCVEEPKLTALGCHILGHVANPRMHMCVCFRLRMLWTALTRAAPTTTVLVYNTSSDHPAQALSHKEYRAHSRAVSNNAHPTIPCHAYCCKLPSAKREKKVGGAGRCCSSYSTCAAVNSPIRVVLFSAPRSKKRCAWRPKSCPNLHRGMFCPQHGWPRACTSPKTCLGPSPQIEGTDGENTRINELPHAHTPCTTAFAEIHPRL